MINKFNRPGKIAKYSLKKLYKSAPTSGLFCTYAGFLALSNGIGQVTFPRKHQEPEITIIITDQIHPILMAGNTIAHWEISPNIPIKSYLASRKVDDETGLVYWDIQKIESLPDNKILPANSILIFAKPKNFYIPHGITLTDDGSNLVLPTIYARRSTDIATNAMKALAIRQFFDSIRNEKKLNGKMYQVHEVY